MKIVINADFGGFGLSYQGCMRYAELAGFKLYAFSDSYGGKRSLWHEGDAKPFSLSYSKSEQFDDAQFWWSADELERNDPLLVQVVEELGVAANDRFACLKIIEIPDGIDWEIDNYDGSETIHEKHRLWY